MHLCDMKLKGIEIPPVLPPAVLASSSPLGQPTMSQSIQATPTDVSSLKMSYFSSDALEHQRSPEAEMQKKGRTFEDDGGQTS